MSSNPIAAVNFRNQNQSLYLKHKMQLIPAYYPPIPRTHTFMKTKVGKYWERIEMFRIRDYQVLIMDFCKNASQIDRVT